MTNDTTDLIEYLKSARGRLWTGSVTVLIDSHSGSEIGIIKLDRGRIDGAEFGDLRGRTAIEKMRNQPILNIAFDGTTGKARPKGKGGEAGAAAVDKLELASGMTIRTKMLLLFSLLPVLMLAALGAFNIQQIDQLGRLLTGKSETIVRTMAEQTIRQKGESVAAELDLYLRENPEVKKEQFQTHPEFKPLAEQTIGQTGYTFVFEAPFAPRDAKFRYWVHPIEPLIGVEFASLEERLGDNFAGIDRVLKQVISNGTNAAEGYYNWLEKDGQIKSKYMTISRVGTTPYIVVATTYIDEFTAPMQLLEEESQAIVKRTSVLVVTAILLSVLVLAFIVIMFGTRLSKQIKNLSSATELISKGDMGVSIIGQEGTDELGALARSVERLRLSVKIMLDRLSVR